MERRHSARGGDGYDQLSRQDESWKYNTLPPKYEYEPGTGCLDRPHSVYNVSAAHLQYDEADFTRSYESAPPERSTGRAVEAAVIVDNQVVEKQEKHTIYKIAVKSGIKSWSVYRRYNDFIALNDQVRRRFPCFQLHLPPKRYFRSSFNPEFVAKRQKLLQEYLYNLLQLGAAGKCTAVAKFFRLDNPPTPDEDLDCARAYCQQLTETINLQSGRLTLTDDHLKTVIGELEESQTLNQNLQQNLNQLKKSSQDEQRQLREKLKHTEEELSACQERERQLRQEHDQVLDQARREREAEIKVRKLCQEKQELAVKELLMKYEETQSDIKRRIETSMSPLLASTHDRHDVTTRTDDVTNDLPNIIRELEHTLTEAETLMKSYHEHVVEGLQSEIQILKSDLAKNEFRLRTALSESTRWKTDFQKVDNRLKQKIKEAKLDKEDMLREIKVNKEGRENIEQRYFHHMVLMLKMTLLNDPRVPRHNINTIDAKELYSLVRQRTIPPEEWPCWIIGQVRGYV